MLGTENKKKLHIIIWRYDLYIIQYNIHYPQTIHNILLTTICHMWHSQREDSPWLGNTHMYGNF